MKRVGRAQKSRSVLITGATRTIGRKFAQKLYYDTRIKSIIACAYEPKPYYFNDYDEERFKYFNLNLLRSRDLSNLFDSDEFLESEIDTVVHLALRGDPYKYKNIIHELHISGTENILRECLKRPGIKKFVFLSSSVVYKLSSTTDSIVDETSPLNFDGGANPIIKDYVDAELLCRAKMDSPTLKIVVLRPSGVIGRNIHSDISAFFDSLVCIKPMGFDPVINPIHADDVVSAITLSIFKNVKGIFNIAGLDTAPLSTFLRLNKRPVISFPEILIPVINKLTRKFWITKYVYSVNPNRLKFNLVLNCEKAKKILDFTPKHHIKFA